MRTPHLSFLVRRMLHVCRRRSPGHLKRLSLLLAGSLLLCRFCGTARAADYRWPDGSKSGTLPGKLLSNNPTLLDKNAIPTDGVFTTRNLVSQSSYGLPDELNNGEMYKYYRIILPAYSPDAPGTIEFDLRQAGAFQAVSMSALLDEARTTPEVQFFTAGDDGQFHRVQAETTGMALDELQTLLHWQFAEAAPGRYLRIENHGGEFGCNEVYIWGEAEAVPAAQSGVPPQLARPPELLPSTVLAETPRIDGKPAAELLSQLPPLTLTTGCDVYDDQTPDKLTRAYAALTPEGLYIAFDCREPEMAARFIARPGGEADWYENQVQVMFYRADLYKMHYFDFLLNSDGKVKFDASRVVDPTRSGRALDIRSAVADDDDGWSAEILIPLAELTADGNFTACDWRLELSRKRYLKNADGSIKFTRITTFPAIPGGTQYVPDQFALLRSSLPPAVPQPEILTGIFTTRYTPDEFKAWQRQLKQNFKTLPPFVFSNVPFDAWTPAHAKFPPPERLNQPVSLTMLGNEQEDLLFFLLNTSESRPLDLELELQGGSERLQAELLVAGIVNLRSDGTVLRPLFSRDNLMNPELMARYLVNGPEIADFPRLHLPPGGGAAVVVNLKSRTEAAGRYELMLSAGGQSHRVPIAVDVKAVNLTAPENLFLDAWIGYQPHQFPFYRADYYEKLADYCQSLGVNFFMLNPLDNPFGRALASRREVKFHLMGLPRRLVQLGYSLQGDADQPLTDEMQREIDAYLDRLAGDLAAHHIGPERYMLELWDEPKTGANARFMGECIKFIKAGRPELQIFCNPACWTNTGYSSDEEILANFGDWYPLVDYSVPLFALYFDQAHRRPHPLWDAEHKGKAFYLFPWQDRWLAWKAFQNGFDGFGVYSYSTFNGNPWNDYDGLSLDYQIFYPGVSGPVPTFSSETARETYEDFAMLKMLQAAGRTAFLKQLLADYPNTSYRELRRRMIEELNRGSGRE